MFQDGFTDALDTPLCPAVSTTLPETDHVFDGVGDGSVGEHLAADDPLPPQLAAQRLRNAPDTRQRASLDTVTAKLASATPTSDVACSQSPNHELSTFVFSPCMVSHRAPTETAEQEKPIAC